MMGNPEREIIKICNLRFHKSHSSAKHKKIFQDIDYYHHLHIDHKHPSNEEEPLLLANTPSFFPKNTIKAKRSASKIQNYKPMPVLPTEMTYSSTAILMNRVS